jgi:hypothetical protein
VSEALLQATDPAPPLVLYQYTTLAGACGIGTTKRLWASSIRHLNDSTEFTYAHGVLREVLEQDSRGLPAGVSAGVEFMVSHLDLSKISAPLTAMGKFGATYVASFSSEPNKLSQWRAYSPGGGYALGFRTEALKVIARGQGFRLVQCSYDRDQHIAGARAIASEVLKHIEGLPPHILSVLDPGGAYSPQATQSWLFPIRQEMTGEIQAHACWWKHPSYAEESEWRLVSEQRLDREVKFRAGRTAIVPYVEIKLDEPEELQVSGMTAVLAHTYIGPCAEPEIAVGSLMHLFEANRMSCPQFTLSGSPYRNW